MNSSPGGILVPFDFSDQSKIALEQSYNLARMLKSSITLLYVIEESSVKKLFSKSEDDELMNGIQEQLTEFVEQATAKTGIKANTLIVRGKVYEKIVELSEMLKSVMIIMGCNDSSGLKKKFIGSNALRVVKEAKVPVITIKGKHHRDGCRNIVLPLDLTKETRDKVGKAIELARIYGGATIRVVSVLQTTDEFVVNRLTRQISLVKKHIESNGISCTAEIVKSIKGQESLADIIIDYAHKVDGDLIMIMTQQEVDFTQYFIGSSAQGIINNSDIPVISIIPLSKEERKTVSPF
jgi:nucleotide-binding universal stress UspA family protein